MKAVGLRTLIRELGDLWLEARCVCGCVTQYPRRYLAHEGLTWVLIGDWASELACTSCGGAEPEVLLWNGVIDTGYGSEKPERMVLLEQGGGDVMEPSVGACRKFCVEGHTVTLRGGGTYGDPERVD